MTTAVTIAAEWLVPVASTPVSPGWVRVEDGRVAACGQGRPPGGADRDFGRSVILPGLINAHTHLGCSFLKGSCADSAFLEWLTGDIAPRVISTVAERPEEIERWALEGARELAAGGVVAAGDSFFQGAGRRALEAVGLRGVFYREVFGSMTDDLDAYVDEVRTRLAADCSEHGRGDVGVGVAPHSPYTCPPQVLEAVAAMARDRDLPLTIHAAESFEERRFLESGDGPMADVFAVGDRRARYRFGASPIASLEELGVLGPRTLVVHAVATDASDAAILANSGASVAHCPTSNMRLATGIAPVREMLDAGVNVCLGTDSAASVGKLDMFEEMRLAVSLQRARTREGGAPDATGVLAMATIAGARALGLDDVTGSIEPGKAADLCIVDLDHPRFQPCPDVVGAIVHAATPADVTATLVGGRFVHSRDGIA